MERQIMTVTKQDMLSMSNVDLLGIYNGLGPLKVLKAWKSSKDKLVERIEALRAVADKNAAAERKADRTRQAAEKSGAARAKVTAAPVETVRTIRATALDLLCHVAFHEDRELKPNEDNVVEANHPRARSVGIAYDEVICGIKAVFPEAQTTPACLRWYTVKVRVGEHGYEGLSLPQRRPRVRPNGRK